MTMQENTSSDCFGDDLPDMMVTTSMLLHLVDHAMAEGKSQMKLHEIVRELVSLASKPWPVNGNSATKGVLDESMTSSISSTAPSPHFGDMSYTLAADDSLDVCGSKGVSDFPAFSFKTPLKTFRPAERDKHDSSEMKVSPHDSTAVQSVGAVFPVPGGVPCVTLNFAMGQPDHKAQVAAIKKKIPTRSARKKAVPPPSPLPAPEESCTPPVPPPNHSSPDHGLDSPAAVSKPFSFSRKLKEDVAPSSGSEFRAVPPPPPFSFSAVIDLTKNEAMKHTGPAESSARGSIDANLAHIAAQFANINFSFPPAPPSSADPSPPPVPNMFVPSAQSIPHTFLFEVQNAKPVGQIDPKPIGMSSRGDSNNLSPHNADKSGFTSVDNLTKKVAGLAVNPATFFGTANSDSFGAKPNAIPQVNGLVFNIGAGGSNECTKMKKIAAVKRRVGQHRSGIENKQKTINVGAESLAPDVSLAPSSYSSEAMSPSFTTPAKKTIHTYEEEETETTMANEIKKSPHSFISRESRELNSDMQGSVMETEEVEDAKRMLSFAELLKSHGNNLFSSKSYEGALDSFSKALDNAPPSWQARLSVMCNKAACLFLLNRFPEVVSACDETVDLYRRQQSLPDDNIFDNCETTLLKIFARKGRALLKLGNFPAAHLAFTEVLDAPRVHGSTQFKTKTASTITNETEMTRADEDAIRMDAKAGIKQILLAKVMYNRLIMLESQSDYKQFLTTADDLLKLSPELRSAHCFKASALCKMQKWAEAKEFIESCVCNKPESIQRLYCFPRSTIPVSSVDKLRWNYDKSKTNHKSTNFHVNIPDVANACLVYGSALSRIYVWALKNDKHSRFLCAETMDVVNNILTALRLKIFGISVPPGSSEDWAWVKDELAKLSHMMEVKNNADSCFRAGDFAVALNGYREFVKLDPDANLWNAVM